MVRVQRGQHTVTFSKSKSTAPPTGPPVWPPELSMEDECSFSIICDEQSPDGRASLDLVASSPEECEFWCARIPVPPAPNTLVHSSPSLSSLRVSGLQLLIFAQRVGVYDGDLKLLYRAFDRAPKHKSGSLTYDQVKAMLRDLNIGVTKSTLKPIFDTVCVTVDGLPMCPLDSVVRIVEAIRDRPDVRGLFQKLLEHQGDALTGLTPDSVLYFMHTYQCETDATLHDALRCGCLPLL